MKLKTIAIIFAFMLVLMFSRAQHALATSTLSILPISQSKGGFVIQGDDMDSVAGLDITITYDSASLSSPQVTKGALTSSSILEVNNTNPGTVRIMIVTVSPISGSGTIAKLAFTQVGESAGKPSILKANIQNSARTELPVNTSSDSAAESTTTTDQGAQTGKNVSSASAGQKDTQSAAGDSSASTGQKGALSAANAPAAQVSPQTAVGVLAPFGASMTAENKGTSPAPPGSPTIPPAAPAPGKDLEAASRETTSNAKVMQHTMEPVVQPTGQSQEKKIYTQKSVLDRFHIYKGERSVKAFVALFDQDPMIGFTQDPKIALSDGKATVKVSFIALTEGGNLPVIDVKGASIVSLKKDPDNTNTWIVVLRLEKKAVSASVGVVQDKVVMQFPITVAPNVSIDLDKSGKATDAGFKRFLENRGTPKKPEFDLNGDGKRDYVDAYIYTANYIAKKSARSDDSRSGPPVKGKKGP